MHLFKILSQTILTLFAAYEFPTLFGLIFIEEMGLPLPLPGDVLIAYAGGRSGHTPVNAVIVIGVVALAATFGSFLLYLFTRHSGPRVIAKLHRVLHLRPERIAYTQGWFRRHGPVAIVLGRLIPGLRTPTSVMAGVANVPARVFVPSSALAAVIWSAFYYFAGTALHRLWAPLKDWAGEDPEQALSMVIFGVAIIAFGWWLRAHNASSRRRQPEGLSS